MNEFVKNLHQELIEDLSLIHDMGGAPVKRLTTALCAVTVALNKLSEHCQTTPFQTDAEKVDFFKHWKPLFESERHYALEKFTVESGRPLTDATLLKAYYEQELSLIRRFFTQNAFLYQYYQFGFSELDQLLFLKGELPGLVEPGTVFAKIIAYEKLQDYLLAEIFPRTGPGRTLKKLTWTGDKVNLVELVYALHDTAQLNSGTASLADIVEWLEDSLGVSLQRYYRIFAEMKGRKSVSPTRFLDHAAAMVREHLRQGDAYVPQPPKSVPGSRSAM